MSSQKRYNVGTIRIRYSTCSRSGCTELFKNENVNVKFSDVKRRRTSSKKNGCPANHEPVAQDQLHLLRINRTMDFLDESFIHKVGTCNISASKAYNLVSSMKGGLDSRGGTAVDFKNFHRDLNCKIGVKDSQMVVDILANRKLCFSNFSFEFQKDVDDHLTGLFWADDTLYANYKEFGDVLSFDATYQTNKVDYHKRCVTFVAGLLARETADAYVWLLEVFLKAFVKPPMMIVTDQDSSMKKAVNFVFPESKHRLCMWHITQKHEEKIPIDVYNHPDFQKTFFDIIWNLQCSPQDFENAYAILRLSINKIANNEDELAKYIKQLQEVDSGIPLCTSSRASSSRSVHIEKIIGVAVPDVINIHNLEGIRNKGWASGKRIKGTREKVIEKSKKGTRLRSLFHKPNHNARSCILRFKKSDLESEVIEG
ncbi:hypothetical protein Lser_V15G40525 [Lactuca serriola]